ENATIMALDRHSGQAIWTTSLPQEIAGTKSRFGEFFSKDATPLQWIGPILAGDHLYSVNQLGVVKVLSPYDGEEIREFSLSSGVILPPLVANETLYFLTNAGTIAAYR
ncbi:MAG: PQQ-binding-like beta-propeller repeat protein, partial [Pseudomonadota bacterium]